MLHFDDIFSSQVKKKHFVFQVDWWWYERAEESEVLNRIQIKSVAPHDYSQITKLNLVKYG